MDDQDKLHFDDSIVKPRRMHEGYSSRFAYVSVRVSVTAPVATYLVYDYVQR